MAEQNNQPETDVGVEPAADPANPELLAAPDIAALEAEVEQLQQQLAEAKDQVLRAAAEAQNARRRAEREVENAHKFALEKFASALLSVADNLERAIASADSSNPAVKPLVEGVELTYRSFIEVLSRFQVEQINPVGEPFDPQFHEAVSAVPNADAEPNTVLEVMQKGYTISGRLLRAAMVVVAKGASKKIDETA